MTGLLLQRERVACVSQDDSEMARACSRVREPATAAYVLVEEIIAAGIDTFFGIPGGAVSPLLGALVSRTDVRIVNAKHEAGAAFMAMGYALMADRPAVVFTTAGPGFTNAITGLASAHHDGIPLLMLSGEVPTTSFGRGALQDSSAAALDAVGTARKVSKFARQLSRADTAATVTRHALQIMQEKRKGPAFLSLPLNVAASSSRRPEFSSPSNNVTKVDASLCARAAHELAKAAKPLLLLGAGSKSECIQKEILRFVERTKIPVATTPKGKGAFPEDHELYLGIVGFGGHESALGYLASGVDVLLVCGSSLNDFSTNAWSSHFNPSRLLIQNDIDADSMGRNYPVDIGLVGHAADVFKEMNEVAGLEECSASRTLTPATPITYQPLQRSPVGALTTAEVIAMLNECCPADSAFTVDMGEHLSVALHYLKIRKGAHFHTALGFGSMGSSIGVAIGMQIAQKHRQVYAICGDGGFLMSGLEVATAVQHAAPVVIVVINDSRFNMCEWGMRDLFGRSTPMETQYVDFELMGKSVGCDSETIHTLDELRAAIGKVRVMPTVLNVVIDPSIRLRGSQRNAALRQFSDRDTADSK